VQIRLTVGRSWWCPALRRFGARAAVPITTGGDSERGHGDRQDEGQRHGTSVAHFVPRSSIEDGRLIDCRLLSIGRLLIAELSVDCHSIANQFTQSPFRTRQQSSFDQSEIVIYAIRSDRGHQPVRQFRATR
jgi:hypothetical protein